MKIEGNEYLLVLSMIVFFAGIPIAHSVGQVAGPIVINVPVGGSNTGSWGLLNNETATLKLSVEGDASRYISLPEKVTIQPNQVYWVKVAASIPSDYNISSNKNITGVLYALLEGSPGQVQINLQLRKNIFIIVEPSQEKNSGEFAKQLMTGLFTFSTSHVILALAIIALVVLIFIKIKRR